MPATGGPGERDGQVGELATTLLAVTGLSPQVVTETIYALARESRRALPGEVHILTTSQGADRARAMLLADQPGWLERLRDDYALPPIRFDDERIHVLHDSEGRPLADIRSALDNQGAADQVAELVRTLTADASAALHVSLAGGRKTLGFFAGYALSLWGRPQDRLSHVLVSDPFESSAHFFYPTPCERVIQLRDGSLADCSQAVVTLADIPFVRLRHGLPERLLEGRASFAEAVAAAQGLVGPPTLVLDLPGQKVVAHGREFALPPADLAFLAWFARRALAGEPALASPSAGVPDRDYARAYLSEYRRIVGPMGDDERTTRRYLHGMGKEDFEERKSKLGKQLKEHLGAAARAYLIAGAGRKPMHYQLELPAQAISFLPPS